MVLLCECKVMSNNSNEAGAGENSKGKSKGKSGYNLSDGACYSVLGSCSDVVFECFEDEVYLQHATSAVLFRPPKQHCSMDLVALLIPISKLKTCVNGICALTPSSE